MLTLDSLEALAIYDMPAFSGAAWAHMTHLEKVFAHGLGNIVDAQLYVLSGASHVSLGAPNEVTDDGVFSYLAYVREVDLTVGTDFRGVGLGRCQYLEHLRALGVI